MPPDTGTFLSLFAPFDQLGWLGIAALLGGYSGIYLFLRGFRMLQHKRLILNTPLSKIRSASMGLVEVSGMAKGPQTIRAGITGEPCYYYRARAWQESDSGKKGGWEQFADETVGVPFFVDDGTGKMLVYPQGARPTLEENSKWVDMPGPTSFRISPISWQPCKRCGGANLKRADIILPSGSPWTATLLLQGHNTPRSKQPWQHPTRTGHVRSWIWSGSANRQITVL
jgi:hypothetical protein